MVIEGVVDDVEPIDVKTYWVAEKPLSEVEISSPELAAGLLAPYLVGADVERCVVLYLDVRRRLMGIEVLGVGTLDRVLMDAWLIFRAALVEGASSIVIGHNHPSGDPTPSGHDEYATRELVDAGRLVRVEVLDHIVFGGKRWVSVASRPLPTSRWEAEPDPVEVAARPGLRRV